MKFIKGRYYHCRIGIFLVKIKIRKVNKNSYWVSNHFGGKFLIVKQGSELIAKNYIIYDDDFCCEKEKCDLKVRVLNEEEQWIECRKSQIRLNVERIRFFNTIIQALKKENDFNGAKTVMMSKFSYEEENKELMLELKEGYEKYENR